MSERIKCTLREIAETIFLAMLVWWVVYIWAEMIDVEKGQATIIENGVERNRLNIERNELLLKIYNEIKK